MVFYAGSRGQRQSEDSDCDSPGPRAGSKAGRADYTVSTNPGPARQSGTTLGAATPRRNMSMITCGTGHSKCHGVLRATEGVTGGIAGCVLRLRYRCECRNRRGHSHVGGRINAGTECAWSNGLEVVAIPTSCWAAYQYGATNTTITTTLCAPMVSKIM